ncbi:MAG: YkgJ family cysteine cluster protein [Cyanobacteriota bacterium]
MDYAKKVEELLKMPQELCKMCGLCCKLASFKGGMSYDEIKNIACDYSDPSQADGAKDFLTIFEPISREDATELSESFVKEITKRFEERQEKVTFFKCRFIKDGNLCQIHEDRPLLCRMYPIPHERTVYHAECGFKDQGIKNWQEIQNIVQELIQRQLALEEEKRLVEEETQKSLQQAKKLMTEIDEEMNQEK